MVPVIARNDPQHVAMQFPVGRTRLETVAVIVCAVIMSIATVLVIRESIGALVDGLAHSELSENLLPPLTVSQCTQLLLALVMPTWTFLSLPCCATVTILDVKHSSPVMQYR